MFETVNPIAIAVMRGVVASGVVTDANMEKALEVMRAELKEFLVGETYADARACVLNKSLNERYVLGLVIAECVAKIKGEPK